MFCFFFNLIMRALNFDDNYLWCMHTLHRFLYTLLIIIIEGTIVYDIVLLFHCRAHRQYDNAIVLCHLIVQILAIHVPDFSNHGWIPYYYSGKLVRITARKGAFCGENSWNVKTGCIMGVVCLKFHGANFRSRMAEKSPNSWKFSPLKFPTIQYSISKYTTVVHKLKNFHYTEVASLVMADSLLRWSWRGRPSTDWSRP